MPNFSFLKSDLVNTTENDSTEFDNQISFFVEKTENRLTNDLDDTGLDFFATVSCSIGNPIVSLPVDAKIVRNINVISSASSTRTNLLQRTYEYAIDFWPHASSSVGEPRYYSRKTNTSIYIVPTPASAVDIEVQYVRRPLGLASATGTSVTTTNYFSEDCYNALFYGCMIEATMYMKSWSDLPIWEAQYQNAINQLRNQARRTRQDDMAQAASPAGGPDTIIMGST
tara:strand:+ start:650 stop:1330 length:681 start_codon:yes stop_codon:yes gene_type:complete